MLVNTESQLQSVTIHNYFKLFVNTYKYLIHFSI